MTDVHLAPLPASKLLWGFNGGHDRASLIATVACGGSLLRGGGGWPGIEDFDTGALALPALLEQSLAFHAEHGTTPILTLAYEPPWRRVATATVLQDTPAGARVVPVELSADYELDPLCDNLGNPPGASHAGWLTGHASYYGTLIAGVDPEGLSLAAKTQVSLAEGTVLPVNRLRYAPISGTDPTQASVQAFIRAALFLAGRLAEVVGRGVVCLGNEYPWPRSKWMDLHSAYETPPAGVVRNDGMKAILQAALAVQWPAGVRWCNGATDKSGFNSILHQLSPLPVECAGVLEGMHPFGNPEAQAWDPARRTAVNPNDLGGNLWKMGLHLEAMRGQGYDVWPLMSECGYGTDDDLKQARSVIRRVLCSSALRATPVIDFLGPAGDEEHPGMGVLEEARDGTIVERSAFLALKGLGELRDSLGDGGQPARVPHVITQAAGAWPLISEGFYGRRGAFRAVCQMTAGTGSEREGHAWGSVPSPEPRTVTFGVPVRSTPRAVNLTTGEKVPVTAVASGRVSVPVADDAIAVVV